MGLSRRLKKYLTIPMRSRVASIGTNHHQPSKKNVSRRSWANPFKGRIFGKRSRRYIHESKPNETTRKDRLLQIAGKQPAIAGKQPAIRVVNHAVNISPYSIKDLQTIHKGLFKIYTFLYSKYRNDNTSWVRDPKVVKSFWRQALQKSKNKAVNKGYPNIVKRIGNQRDPFKSLADTLLKIQKVLGQQATVSSIHNLHTRLNRLKTSGARNLGQSSGQTSREKHIQYIKQLAKGSLAAHWQQLDTQRTRRFVEPVQRELDRPEGVVSQGKPNKHNTKNSQLQNLSKLIAPIITFTKGSGPSLQKHIRRGGWKTKILWLQRLDQVLDLLTKTPIPSHLQLQLQKTHNIDVDTVRRMFLEVMQTSLTNSNTNSEKSYASANSNRTIYMNTRNMKTNNSKQNARLKVFLTVLMSAMLTMVKRPDMIMHGLQIARYIAPQIAPYLPSRWQDALPAVQQGVVDSGLAEAATQIFVPETAAQGASFIETFTERLAIVPLMFALKAAQVGAPLMPR